MNQTSQHKESSKKFYSTPQRARILWRKFPKQENHEAFPDYEPVSRKAADFHHSLAKIRTLPGGNRSGKTTTASKEGVDIIRQAPPNMQGIALTDTYENIGKFLWPKYKEWLLPHEWRWGKGNHTEENPKLIVFPKNNFRLYFGSYEQKRAAQQGASWYYAHFDEEPPYNIFTEVYRGTLDYNGKVFLSYTPIEGYEYIQDFISQGQDPTNSRYWSPQEPMSIYENKHIPREEIEMWEAMLSERGRQVRIYGYAMGIEGVVYGNFSPDTHVCAPFPIPSDWKFYRAIDFGKVHPTVSLILATDGWNIYVIDEYYQAGRLVEYHIERMWKQWHRLKIKDSKLLPRLHTISDHDAQLRLEYANPKFGEKRIHSIPAQKEIIAGIEVVESLLEIQSNGEPRLKVFSTCTETIKEFKRYKYPDKDKHGDPKPGEKADTPEKQHDHCMDDIRYACVQEFGYLNKQLSNLVSIRKD